MIVEELPYSRSVALSVYVSVGSRDEPRGQEGLAHLLEHIMFKGTRRMTSREASVLIESAGGELNGYTGKETTCYYTVTLDKTIGTGESILADMMTNPLIDPRAVEIEKNVVAEEIRMLKDDPNDYIHYLFTRALWNGHPMAFSETGELDGVNPLTETHLRSFFESSYRPPNLVVAASGNIAPGRIETWASDNLDALGSAGTRNGREAPASRSGFEFFHREGDQTYVGMGFPGVSAGDPDRYAQTLLSAILGAGTSSRLYQKVREDMGLAYSIYTMSQPYSDCGFLGIFFSSKSSTADTVVRTVASEINKVKRDGLEKGELTRARRLIEGILVRRLESTDSRIFHLGEFYVLTGKVPTEAEILADLERVKEEDIVAVARRIMDRGRLCVAVHGPSENGEKDKENLEGIDF